MDYFMLKSGHGYALAAGGVADSEGRLLKEEGVAEGRSYFAYRDEDESHVPFGDLISPYNPLLISERTKELLSALSVPPDAQWFDAIILDPTTDERVGCACGLLVSVMDVIDPDDAVRYDRESPVDRGRGLADPPIVLRSRVGTFDLVYGLHTLMLVSGRFKKATEELNLSNFSFRPVRMR